VWGDDQVVGRVEGGCSVDGLGIVVDMVTRLCARLAVYVSSRLLMSDIFRITVIWISLQFFSGRLI